MFDILGVRTFQEWIRYRYGVFSEVGFPNDPMYPAYYSLGPETLKNEGCNTTLSASEEKYYQKFSRSNSSRSGNGIVISRQMVSHCLTFSLVLVKGRGI